MITLMHAQDGGGAVPVAAPGAPRQAGLDTMSLWHAVFDAAHAVAGRGDGAGAEPKYEDASQQQVSGASRPERPSTSPDVPAEVTRAAGFGHACTGTDPVDDGWRGRAPSPATGQLAPAWPAKTTGMAAPGLALGAGDEPAATAAPRIQAEVRPLAVAPANGPAVPQGTAPEVETDAEAEASTAPLPGAPLQQPLPAESVLVLAGAAGLEVVVRHTGLAPQSAVWCALEAARQLTGRRESLQHVVLNGRTVYDATQQPGTPAGPVQFKC
jgi:hypothetical protein